MHEDHPEPSDNGLSLNSDQDVLRVVVLPALYVLSIACAVLLRGERKERAALAQDVDDTRAAIGELIALIERPASVAGQPSPVKESQR